MAYKSLICLGCILSAICLLSAIANANQISHIADSNQISIGSDNVGSTDIVSQTMDKSGLQAMSFYIGPEIYSFEYKESKMSEKGPFAGVSLGFTSRSWARYVPFERSGFMFGAEGRFAYGNVDYDGQTWGGTPVTADGLDDLNLEGRVLLGADFLGGDTVNTMYSGLGYRYLSDDMSEFSGGYLRESNYFYVPVGYQFINTYKAGWSIGFRLEYDIRTELGFWLSSFN